MQFPAVSCYLYRSTPLPLCSRIFPHTHSPSPPTPSAPATLCLSLPLSQQHAISSDPSIQRNVLTPCKHSNSIKRVPILRGIRPSASFVAVCCLHLHSLCCSDTRVRILLLTWSDLQQLHTVSIRADSHYTSRFRSVTVPSPFRQIALFTLSVVFSHLPA